MQTCELCEQTGGTLVWQNAFCRVVLVEDADYAGFCRVICNEHVAEMTDLAIPQRSQMMMTVCKVEQAIRDVMQPDKINLASLGNVTPHLHWHVIPRYYGDKHFPQPIWGTVQRLAELSPPNDWRSRLFAHIQSSLTV
jgi:diadenosine tetraphosphate (Ap4A) HIT family hydrolase